MNGYQGNPKQRSMAEGSQLFALRKNGTEFQIKVSLSPIKDDEELTLYCGSSVGYYGTRTS